MLKEKAKPCAGLSEKVLNEMYSDGYSPKSVDHHVRPIYNRLARYCEGHFEGMYSVDAGEAFIRTIQRKKPAKGADRFEPKFNRTVKSCAGRRFSLEACKVKVKAICCFLL